MARFSSLSVNREQYNVDDTNGIETKDRKYFIMRLVPYQQNTKQKLYSVRLQLPIAV